MLQKHSKDINDLAVDLGPFAHLAVFGAKRRKIPERNSLLSLNHCVASKSVLRATIVPPTSTTSSYGHLERFVGKHGHAPRAAFVEVRASLTVSIRAELSSSHGVGSIFMVLGVGGSFLRQVARV